MGKDLGSDPRVAELRAEKERLLKENQKKQEEMAKMGLGIPADQHENFVTWMRTQALLRFLDELDPSGLIFAMYERCYQESLRDQYDHMIEKYPEMKAEFERQQARAWMEQEAAKKTGVNGSRIGQSIILPGQTDN